MPSRRCYFRIILMKTKTTSPMRQSAIALLASVALAACAATATTSPVPAETSGGATNKAAELARQQQSEPKPAKELSPEERAQRAQVSERSGLRNAAIMKRDYATGYSFSAPGWRALYTVDHFRNQVSGITAWKSAEVVDVACESADKCRVRVRVNTISLASGKRGSSLVTHVDEIWLREANEWFFAEYR